MNQTEIEIRTARLEDAEALLRIYEPYVKKTAITFEYDVPEIEEFTKRMEKTLSRYPYLVAETEGEIVGYAYAGAFKERKAYDWAVETSIYVSRDKRRSGIGSRLYEALENILKQQNVLNVNACIACPQTEDEYLTMDSVNFHERMGYHLVGRFHQCGYKFNRWYDMVWMEKHIGVHQEKQPAFLPFAEWR